MNATSRVRRFATLVVLILTTTPLGADARQFVCRPIVRGDTASGLALRLTGDAATRHSPSFQVRDPAQGVFVPKSRYERLSTHWQACVARDFRDRVASLRLPDGRPQRPSPYNTTLAWRVGLAAALMLFVSAMVVQYVTARSIPPAMQRAGEQFVSAFARPLIDPSSDVPPISVRLRFVRHAEQLEICIAPNAGRRYPNLLDHRQNVEYDVNRVMQLLGTHVVVRDRLRAEGKWVVVPIRRADLKQVGAK